MKIKRKVEMNLPQLIEWVIENKKFGCTYISDNFNKVYVTDDGIIEFNGSFYRDIFTIITFEDITEDTELDLVLRFIAEDKAYYTNPQTMSINTCLEAERDDVTKTHFYIENDERELVLIWRDGRLVE
ncbi:hypothetical protein [Staphylococcus equorum]|uniref:hypothetical protein n=1 Tax=Staphylococcus equorum TaxID=246432 RepID=UPI002554860A|nr:hypothetical protein [Staphylococcus equorum]MDK9870261.1 hypothetical protein [Staphylococcus equorum]